MKDHRPLVQTLLFLVLCATQTAVFSWGLVGHRIVCDIAHQELNEAARREVDRLISSYRKPNGKAYRSFVDSCALPDLARRNAREGYDRWQRFARFDRWHYMNVPRNAPRVTIDGCNEDCVLFAIGYHADALNDRGSSPQTRGEALIFLAHWVADVHQPLHVAFADDRGGSAIKLPEAGYYGDTHFHAVWDTAIVKRARGRDRARAYITRLREAIDDTDRAKWANVVDPIDWAEESYRLTVSEAFKYCRWRRDACRPYANPPELDATYQRRFAPVVERRLQQAAVRLAMMIERALR